MIAGPSRMLVLVDATAAAGGASSSTCADWNAKERRHRALTVRRQSDS
jgi:hypothetical protein